MHFVSDFPAFLSDTKKGLSVIFKYEQPSSTLIWRNTDVSCARYPISGLRTLVHRIFRNIQIIQKDTTLIRCNQSRSTTTIESCLPAPFGRLQTQIPRLHIYETVAHYCTFTVLFTKSLRVRKHHFTLFHFFQLQTVKIFRFESAKVVSL